MTPPPRFKGRAEQEASGMVTCGFLFDDSCHAAADPKFILAVNANSSHKEGAWDFISFLISEDLLNSRYHMWSAPVHRAAFDKWLPKSIDELTQVRYENGVRYIPQFYNMEITEERKAEYIQAIEEASPFPIRTASILTIILEESKGYFDGYKSAEEVGKTINNRVQLYLEEQKQAAETALAH